MSSAVLDRLAKKPESSTVPNISGRQKQLLAAIPEGAAVTPAEITSKVGAQMSARTMRRELDALTVLNLIERSGWGRSVRYTRRRSHGG